MLTKYIGKPYEEYNCFDLVKEFYKDHFDLDICHYYEGTQVPDKKTVESLVVTNKGDFEKFTSPEFGDIVVINLYGYSCHIGVCVGDGRFLHSVRKIGSCMEPLSKYSRMIEGYYRHREHQHD